MHRYTVSSLRVRSVTYAQVRSLTPSSLSLSNSHLHRQMWAADMRRYALSSSNFSHSRTPSTLASIKSPLFAPNSHLHRERITNKQLSTNLGKYARISTVKWCRNTDQIVCHCAVYILRKQRRLKGVRQSHPYKSRPMCSGRVSHGGYAS